MKNTVTILAAFALSAGVSSAATAVGVTNSNLGTQTALSITDNAGNALTSINFGVGTFESGFDFAGADAAAIKAGFDVLATGTGANSRGFFSSTASVTLSPQDGSTVYVVFYGDQPGGSATADDLASAGDFIVIGGPGAYVLEDAATNSATVGNPIQDGSILYGQTTVRDNSALTGPFANLSTDGVTFGGAIPEPSTALLSLVGLAFVARRRR
ncbi:PEP-CTERM sorting domain-containing protein [bacterium]|nr:PEP-CTERM sorting domain-containing protein [bacterium]